MNAFERREEILNLLRAKHNLRVTELSEMFNVSEGTIRNDLDYLSDRKQIRRVHGGAVIEDQAQILNKGYAQQAQDNLTIKRRIARWATTMVNDGDAIFLDASPTTFHMVSYLRQHRNLTILTSGIEAALSLAALPSFTVILMGGIVHPGTSSVTGQFSESALEQLHIKTAFLSCTGISPRNDLTEADIAVADLKRKVVASVEYVVALIESDKFGQASVSTFAHLDQLAHIFTDDNLTGEYVEQIRKTSAALTLCGEHKTSSYTPLNTNARHLRIGFANISEDRAYAVNVRRGLEEAARAAGHIDLIITDNKYDRRTAFEAADYLIDAGVDLAIEYHFDEETGMRIIEKFKRANIPVIAVDTPMVGATFFGADSYRSAYDGGLYLGQWARDNWDGQYDRIVLIEHSALRVGMPRIKGQMDALEEMLGAIPENRITSLDSGSTAAADIARLVETFLHENPDLRRVIALSYSDTTAEGIVMAARETGRTDHVVSISLGAGTRFIRSELHQADSCIVAATTYSPEAYGQKLVALAEQILQGEPVPPAVYIDHVVIDRETVDSVYPL